MGDLGQKCLSARFSAFKLISIYFTQTVLIETLSLNCLSYTPRRKFINRDRVKWIVSFTTAIIIIFLGQGQNERSGNVALLVVTYKFGAIKLMRWLMWCQIDCIHFMYSFNCIDWATTPLRFIDRTNFREAGASIFKCLNYRFVSNMILKT